MKKILLLSTVLTLFFCLGLKKTAYADAYYSSIEMYETDNINGPFAFTMSEGYYIVGAFPYILSKDNFIGDYIYYHTDIKENVDMEDIKKTGTLKLPETILQSELIDDFNSSFVSMPQVGAVVLKVNSSAVYYSDVDSEYTLSTYALLTSELNTDPSYAGNKHHFTSIDQPLSIENLKGRYSAEDNVDGNITNRISLETNYDPSHIRLGKYYVAVKVKDSANHETSVFDIIECMDFIPPKISFLDNTSEITVEVNTGFQIKDAQNHFLVSDNYTKDTQIQKSYVDMNKFKQELGTYNYKLLAKDSSFNLSEAILKIHVVDTTKPTISLKESGDTIYADHVLEDGEIRALFDVSDNYYTLSPEDLKIVSNTCTGIEGAEYELTLSLTDGSNNSQEITVKYYLSDTQSPIIRVEKTLFLPLGQSFSNKQILDKLKEAGIISPDATNVSFSYDPNCINTEGCYEIKYVETTQDGEEIEGTIMLNVFSPYETIPSSSSNSSLNYLWLLLILIPIISVGILFKIRTKKMKKCSLFILIFFCFICLSYSAYAKKEAAHFHIINYDSPLSFEQIKARYSCYDKKEGNLTEKLKFESEYIYDLKNQALKVKDYPLQVSISNSLGQTTSRIDYISVRDFTAPILKVKQKELKIDISTQEIIPTLLDCFEITDNYDTNFNYDWIGLEDLEQGTGTYSIQLIVYDSSKNSTVSEAITVRVVESTFYHIITESIMIEQTAKSKEEILEEVLKYADIDSNYQEIAISSTYFDTPLKQGTYQVSVTLSYADGIKHIYQCKIINKITKGNKNYNTIIIISSLCTILFVGLIGIFFYRKRR